MWAGNLNGTHVKLIYSEKKSLDIVHSKDCLCQAVQADVSLRQCLKMLKYIKDSNKPGSGVIKKSCSTQLNMKFIPAHKC